MTLRPLPFVTGGAFFALVALWTFLQSPLYRSEALLQIEEPKGPAGLSDAVAAMPGAALLGVGSDELETRMGVLRSRRVIDAIVDSLGLEVQVVEPAMPRSEVLTAVRGVPASATNLSGTVTLTRGDAGSWAIAGEDLPDGLSLPATLGAGDTLNLSGVLVTLGEAVAEESLRRIELSLVSRQAARSAIHDRLEIRRQSAGAKLIALTYDDADPATAARVLERMLAEFMAYTAGAARGDAGSTVAELGRQIDEQRVRLTAAEEAQRAYQERTGVVMPSEQASAEIERYGRLQATADLTEVEIAALVRLLALAERRAGDTLRTAAFRQLAAFPTLMDNRGVQELRIALTGLEEELSELRLSRSETNADVQRVTARITQIEGQLKEIAEQYLEGLREQLAPTQAAVARIDSTIAQLPERELRFVRLARESAALNEGYMLLLKQLRQVELQDALRLDAVRVVDAPSLPDADEPYSPRVLVNLVLGLVLAVASGGAVAAFDASRRVPAAATSVTE